MPTRGESWRTSEHPEENHTTPGPLEIVGEWLQNLLDPDIVGRVMAPDATYVSLNTDNPELAEILPWAGTSYGPQACLDNLSA